MKNLLSKLKLNELKPLLLEHGEKVAVGIAGVIAVLCLFGALGSLIWGGYGRTPVELTDSASKAQQQLVASQWPVDQQQQYAVVDFQRLIQDRVTKPVNVAMYDYRTPMSPKMNLRNEAVTEPQWLPVENPIATSGKFVMALAADSQMMGPADGSLLDPGLESGDGAGGDEVDAEFARKNSNVGGPGLGRPVATPAVAHAGPTAKGPRAGHGAATAIPASPLGPMPGAETAEVLQRVRGVRYVAVRGVFPLRAQLDKFQRAMHLESITQAIASFELLDFELQRQRAVRGDSPWSGEWKSLDVQTELDLMQEASDFEPDVVATEVTDSVITMPLLPRLMGDWWSYATHPDIDEWLLKSQEEVERELEKNARLVEEGGKHGIDGRSGRGGFAGAQRDLNGLNRAVMQVAGVDGMPGRHPGMTAAPGLAQAGPMARPGMAHAGIGPAGMMGPAAASGPSLASVPKYLLFRYFDSTVDPGAAYRYRVRLKLRNPNHDLAPEQVKDPSVAEGDFRWTDWSEPTPPVVVEEDTEYFLAQVPRSLNRPKPGARLNIFQWNPELGTLVGAEVTNVPGEFVGGKTKTKVLDLAKQSLGEEEITIYGRDLVVDSEGAPPLNVAQHEALGIDKKAWLKLSESAAFDHAVTVDPAGQIQVADALSVARDKERAEKRLTAQHEANKDLEETEETAASPLDAIVDTMDPMRNQQNNKKNKRSNPLNLRNPMMAPAPAGPGPAAAHAGPASKTRGTRGSR